MHAHLRAREEQRVRDVVAVADVRRDDVREGALALADREDVRKALARVRQVGQSIDDRDRRVLREFLERLVGEGAEHDDVDVAAHHPRDVRDTLAAAEADLLR